MLSAVAKRKAALAAAATTSTPTTSTVPLSKSDSPEPSARSTPVSSSERTTAKRKASFVTHNTSAQKKRRRKQKIQNRYFITDAEKDSKPRDDFVQQEDLIVVDSPSSDEEIDSSDSDFPSDSGAVEQEFETDIFVPKSNKNQSLHEGNGTSKEHRWSPSAPASPVSSSSSSPTPQHLQPSKPSLTTYTPTPNTILPLPTAPRSSLIYLSPGTSLCLLGTYTLTLIRGNLSLCGVTLHPSRREHAVYAPRSSAVPVLVAEDASAMLHEDEADQSNIQTFLGEQTWSVMDEDARSWMQKSRDGTIVVITTLETGVQGLGNICKTFDDVYSPRRGNGVALEGVDGVWLIQDQHQLKDTSINPFVFPSSWSNALSALSIVPSSSSITNPATTTSPTFLIKGPKKSGKSTFARVLLNRLLMVYRRVAFLECDPGQSEFTPGGMVALNVIENPVFGPPYTHPTLPNRAHYIGSSTPRSSPGYYLDAICDLVRVYREQISFPLDFDEYDGSDDGKVNDVIPLVVNTMGWVKGLGADLVRRIEDAVAPDAVCEVLEPDTVDDINSGHHYYAARHVPAHGIDPVQLDLLPSQRRFTIHPVPAPLTGGYTPADHRSLALLSYFHAAFSRLPAPSPYHDSSSVSLRQITATKWNTSLPLLAIPPWDVDLSLAVDSVVLTGAGSEDVVPEEVGRVLGGAVVGLVCCEADCFEAGSETGKGLIPYIQGSPPPAPQTSTCFGLALVRGVKPSIPENVGGNVGTKVHVLTPLPPTLLPRARVWVKGELELSIWGFLNFQEREGEAAKKGVPYLQWGRAQGVLGAERRRVRRNLMRRGQI